MKEQFYINGVLMEQADGKAASLVYQSPFFTDIDNIVSNRTNAVEFPVTPANLEAIDNIHLPGSTSRYAYRRHKVLYYRDVIQVFSGYGTLLGLTEKAIKFSFTWGNVNTFKTLLDMKLRSLTPTDEQQASTLHPIPTHVDWTLANISSSRFFDDGIRYGGNQRQLPVMPVADLLTVLSARSGVEFEGANRFSKYCIPLVTRNGDARSKEYSGLILTHNAKLFTTDYCKRTILTKGASDADPEGWYSGDGIFDVSELDTIRIKVSSLSFTTMWKVGNQTRNLIRVDFRVMAVDEDGQGAKEIGRIQVPWAKSGNYINAALTGPKEISVNVADYSYIILCINDCELAGRAEFQEVTNLSANVRLWDVANEIVEADAPYPLWTNLPDWTCSQLLKNLMKIEGVFPVCPDDHTVRFISIEALYTGRSGAADWTDRLMGEPMEQTSSFGSYARENRCLYADDDTVAGDYSGVLPVESEVLDAEGDLVKLDFAGTDSDEWDGAPRIPSYTYNAEDNVYEFQEVKPRILQKSGAENTHGQARHTFDGLAWGDLLAKQYYYYTQTVKLPKVLKATVRMDAADLTELDLTAPVYFFQLGHYYAVTKVTTKDNDTADVELLQLGEVKEESNLPTGTKQLVVVQNADGDWYATLRNYAGEVIQAIREDPDYKVCLLRYGYARRGKTIIYDPATHPYGGDEQPWSHAYRVSPQYKHVRGGLNYRVIGDELLKRRRDHWKNRSQTASYYTAGMLVFDLLDTITLPPMRSTHSGGQSGSVTKNGRIRNRASNGLTDLCIGLYKRDAETNKWTRISNLVQVRGRSSDKTELWEFDAGNIVEVL